MESSQSIAPPPLPLTSRTLTATTSLPENVRRALTLPPTPQLSQAAQTDTDGHRQARTTGVSSTRADEPQAGIPPKRRKDKGVLLTRDESERLRTLSVDIPESLYDSLTVAVAAARLQKRKEHNSLRSIAAEALGKWLEENDQHVFNRGD